MAHGHIKGRDSSSTVSRKRGPHKPEHGQTKKNRDFDPLVKSAYFTGGRGPLPGKSGDKQALGGGDCAEFSGFQTKVAVGRSAD